MSRSSRESCFSFAKWHLKATEWALTIEVESVLICHSKVLIVWSKCVSFDQTDYYTDVITLNRCIADFLMGLLGQWVADEWKRSESSPSAVPTQYVMSNHSAPSQSSLDRNKVKGHL